MGLELKNISTMTHLHARVQLIILDFAEFRDVEAFGLDAALPDVVL